MQSVMESVQIVRGNLFDVTEGIIVHQVNAKGKMGAGLAAQIRAKYPAAYERYMQYWNNGNLKLGTIQLVGIEQSTGQWDENSRFLVCNFCGQEGYGRDRCYTDYKAVELCLKKLSTYGSCRKLPIYFPFMMGCKLGGGSWESVYYLINRHCPNSVILKP